MRRVSPRHVLLALAACGDAADDDGPTACEVGPSIFGQALAELRGGQPACTRDDDCVYVDLDITCDGYENRGCGDILHREAAARFSAAAVCRDIEQASRPGELSCSVQASCSSPGLPSCRAGRCWGLPDGQ